MHTTPHPCRRVVPVLFTAATILVLGFGPAACTRGPSIEQLEGFAQGTTWHISLWQVDGADPHRLQQQIDAELVRLDESLSNYRPDSTIERFNAQASTNPIPVGSEIVSLVASARAISEASRGCYDLTVKPLFELWGFAGDRLTEPDAPTLARVRAQVGFHLLESLAPDRLRKGIPDLRIDLSSIGQGYSVARLATVLEDAGIEHYLVEIGGELQTRGHKPDGSPWRVGLERPLPGGQALQKTLTVRRERPLAVMTSGTYRHYFDAHGKRFSHILDGRTGRPVEHDTVSVTVLGDDPTLADAWATALLCLGERDGMPVADDAGIAALFIADREAALVESATRAWRSLDDVDVR